MVKITLFKDIPFNNGCVMSNFQSFQDQKDFFDNYPINKKLVLYDVKISKLDAPILINRELTEIFNYTYGAIDFDSQRVIYFSVNRFEIETVTKTWLYFNIDYWETYRYPKNNGNGLKLGRSRISRCSLDLGNRIYKPYSPNNIKYRVLNRINVSRTLFFTYHRNADNSDYLYMIRMNDNENISYLIGLYLGKLNERNTPSGGQATKINVNNVYGIWLSPLDFGNAVLSLAFTEITDTGITTPPFKMYYSELHYFNYRLSHSQNIFYAGHTFNVDLANYNKDKVQIGLTDGLGNLIWETKNKKYGNTLRASLNVSMTTCVWLCYWNDENGNVDLSLDSFSTIPCEPIDIFGDNFIDYYTQERPFNQQLREKQLEKQTIDSIANIGTSAIGGAISGAVIGSVGGPIGAGVGAIAGAGLGVASTGINYFTTQEFNKNVQKIEDAKALVGTDPLRLIGRGLYDFACNRTAISIIEISYDDESYNAYLEEVETFGYFYDREINDLDNLLISNSTFKITCNCEVENVPAIAEQSIKARLSAGVKFIRPT